VRGGGASEVVETVHRLRLTGLRVSSLGEVSVRHGRQIWITPASATAWKLRASDVAAVELSGVTLSGGSPSSELPLHLEIYKRLPETGAVVHIRSPWATAWSYLGLPLPSQTEELAYHALGSIRCARRATPGTHALASAACDALSLSPVAFLHSHGVVAIGESPTKAFELCALVEQQAQVQWLIRLSDRKDGRAPVMTDDVAT
jgi:L-fuculose-phosphate aldolase